MSCRSARTIPGLQFYPIYDLGINLDKSIYSQIYDDGESDDKVACPHTFQKIQFNSPPNSTVIHVKGYV
jgi:hypothetical protein